MRIITQEQLKDLTRQELLVMVYPKAGDLWPVNGDSTREYSVSDYFGMTTRLQEGDFFDFIRSLVGVSNRFADVTIKKFFDRKDIVLDYDEEFPTHALYILGTGVFNGITYTAKAISTYKYNEEQYVIEAH